MPADDKTILIKKINQLIKRDNSVLLFALLVYNEETPYMRKILRDPDFRDALSGTSGKRLAVFAIEDKTKSAKNDHGMFYTIQTDNDDTLIKTYSTILTKLIDQPVQTQYPYLVIFQLIKSEITDFLIVDIPTRSADETFNELHRILQNIAGSISQVKQENFGNREEIFNLAESCLRNSRIFSTIKKGVKNLKEIKSTLSLI